MRSLRIVAVATGHDLADGLVSGSEVGLLHLRAVSQVIGRKIRVWDASGKIVGVFGSALEAENTNNKRSSLKKVINKFFGSRSDGKFDEQLMKSESNLSCGRNCLPKQREKIVGEVTFSEGYLELEYNVPKNDQPGHWNSKGIKDTESKGNNCLFHAVCQQCMEYEPNNLRLLTAKVIRCQDVIIEEGFPQYQGLGCFLLGGARYNGSSKHDARRVIDDSQGRRGHGHVAKAHPRGHASYPNATGDIDSVENYSRSAKRDFPKSAWLSRDDQDDAIHRLLLSPQCQDAMETLNNVTGTTRVVIKMSPGFEIRMGLWAGGEMFRGPIIAENVTILLQHHEGSHEERNADVHIFTCYPMAPSGSAGHNEMSLSKQIEMKRSLSPADDENEDYEPSKKISKYDL